MKNKLLLAITSLLAVATFVGCDPIQAKPANGEDALVQIEGKEYFQNNYQKVYDQLVKSGNLTSLTFKKLVKTIVDEEIDKSTFFENLDQLKQDLIDEEMLTKVSSSSYAKDGKFYESKLIESLANSLYSVEASTENHEGIYIKPNSKVQDILGDDYCKYSNGAVSGRYAEYVEKEILSEINQKLLTVKYICENEFSALGRAYARRVNYVKLSNISKQPGAASRLVTKWLNDWIENGENSSEPGVLDLDSLARIWKGVNLTAKEEAYVNANNVYTLKDEIEDEIKKVAVVDSSNELVLDADGNFSMLPDADIDHAIESKYTGNNTYPLAVGYEKALRDLSAKQLSDSDLYTKTNGISGLPSSISDRIFSPSVASFVKESRNVKFLFPAKTETGNSISQYYFYESGEDAYYIVTIDNYDYSSSTLKNAATKDADGNIKKVTNEIANIALELASSSTYKSKALIDIFEKYGLGDEKFNKSTNIHDQTFYDYMKSNYGDIFED